MPATTSPAPKRSTVIIAASSPRPCRRGCRSPASSEAADPADRPTAEQQAAEPTPRPTVAGGPAGPSLERAGLDVGFAARRTRRIAAAVSYATASQRWLYFTDDEIRAAVAEIATPIAAPRMADDVVARCLDGPRAARRNRRAGSGGWSARWRGGSTTTTRRRGPGVGVGGHDPVGREVAAPQSEFLTVTLDLTWVDGDWRVDGVRDTPGPDADHRPAGPAVGRRAVRRAHSTGSPASTGSRSVILGIGFPNPIGWAIDKVTGFVGGVATAGFEMIIGGLVAWVVDAVVWVVGGVFNFFIDSTDPNVQADWFITGDGPYATTVSIGASLLLLFVLAGIVQGTLSGDVGGMLRRMALELPVSVIGMVGLVTITQILIQLTDALSGEVIGNFQDDISEFGCRGRSPSATSTAARPPRSWCSSSDSSPCSPGSSSSPSSSCAPR
jgi:hypothetical protein